MRKFLLLLFAIFLAFNIHAQNAKASFKIFPNPATDYIMLNDSKETVTQVVVYNVIGRKMKTFKAVEGKKYVLSDLAKGVYLVQLLDKKSKILTTQRVRKR